MIYIVKPGDTLAGIAAQFGFTPKTIMENNVICNPNLIFIDQPIYIPNPAIEYGKVGGYPYYVVQFGDTLECLAAHFNQTVTNLAAANQLSNPNQIFVGDELLVGVNRPNPEVLFSRWNPDDCEYTNNNIAFDYHLSGSYLWESLGENAVPYLIRLLKHKCATIRFFAVVSLGRIATGDSTRLALEKALKDEDSKVIELAHLALYRTELVKTYTKRLHLVTNDLELMPEPKFESPSVSIPVPRGTEVISLRWKIPSTTDEEGPWGGALFYDQVQILKSGKVGYLPRLGLGLI